jgi:hypothetical protein
MLKRAERFGISKLVRKSSVEGKALARLRVGFTSSGFFGFFHLYVPDFLSCVVGETCAGCAESAKSASLLLASGGGNGSGASFFLRNLFIVILQRSVQCFMRRRDGSEGLAIDEADDME